MITHSYSKRTAKALPQRETTMLVENIDKKIIKCKARKGFALGYASVKQGETFFLVRSERRVNRYYLVKFNTERRCYQCSCGGGACEHDHLKMVREYIKQGPVETNTIVTTTSMPQSDEKAESGLVVDETAQTTPIDWKAVMKADKARQKAWRQEYWAKVREARAQQQEAV